MKGIFISVASAFFIFQLTNGGIIEDLSECKAKSNVTESDIVNYLNHRLPETREGQCLVACMMKKAKMMGEDGKVSVEGMKNSARIMAKGARLSDDYLKAAFSLMDTCAAAVNPEMNECDVAMKLTGCFIEKGKEMGMPRPEFTKM